MMKNELRLIDHGMFMARTPLLPLAMFRQWAQADDPKKFVRELYQNPLLMDALYLASPSLYDRCREFFSPEAQAGHIAAAPDDSQKKLAARQADEHKLYLALSKYLARAAFRCTPFGLFAAVTPGAIGEKTTLAQLDDAPLAPRVRLDFGLQAKIVKWLLSDAPLRKKLLYQANSSLSIHGKKMYFVEGIDTAMHKRYRFTQIERETYLDSLLALAQKKTTFDDLRTHLIEQVNVDTEEADTYLNDLIDSEILVPDLGIRITGPDSFTALAEKLETISERDKIAGLEQLLATLPDGTATPAAAPGWSYKFDHIHHAMNQLKWFEVERKNIFQVDTQRIAAPTLSQNVTNRIARATALLSQLTMRRVTYLDDFKRRFSERFEDKETPLDKVFNDEIGIPFPKVGGPISDLLQGIDFPGVRNAPNQEIKWDAFDKLLFKKFGQALAQGATEIDISEQDVREVYLSKKDVPFLRGGVFAQAMLFAPEVVANAAAADAGADEDMGIYLQSAGGRTGVELLGRFCDLDHGLTTKVRAILAKQDPDDDFKIHAEVVHLPQDRIVNVVARPVLRQYEIPYLGVSGVAEERQIPVSDLLISLQDNRFVLRSKRLNKQVIPSLTSAHNYSGDNLNVYRFLCCMASQDQPKFGFEWSTVFRAAEFLPRVTLEGVVVSLATWGLEKLDIDALRTALDSGVTALSEWRHKRKIPRFISLDMSDNVLPVDLENGLMVQMLLDEVGKQNRIDIKEAISLNLTTGHAHLGRRNIEVIIPFQIDLSTKDQTTLDHAANRMAHAHIGRPDKLEEPYLYLPGSEWTYFKIYCGQSQVDELLSQYLAPLMRTCLDKGLIDQWFFIRYSDPEHHIRIRALSAGPDAAIALHGALAGVCKTALQDGFGWKVLIDGYDREVLRYGGLQAIGHCEKLFHLDTELIVDFINDADTQIPVSKRWMFAVFCVTALLDAFGLDMDEKGKIVRNMAESFRREFHFGPRQKVQVGAKYRSYRPQLDAAVFGRGTESPMTQEKDRWLALIDRYQNERAAQVNAIKALADDGKLAATLEQVIGSLVHMHCNRLFIADQRAHEAVFYDFLDRIQDSLSAVGRVKGKSPQAM